MQFFDPNAIPRSLDAIYNAYQAVQQREKDEQRQMVSDTLNYGFNPSQVTPGILAQAQKPQPRNVRVPFTQQGMAMPGQAEAPSPLIPSGAEPGDLVQEEPLVGQIRSFLERKRAAQGLELQGAQMDVALKGSQITKNLADAGNAGKLDPAKRAELSNKLRDDLRKDSGPFVTMRNYYSKMQASASDPTGASDWALVYAFNKMLDEASAVRDPEVQNTINTGSAYQSAQAFMEKLKSGQKLGPEGAKLRADLVKEGKKLFKAIEPYQNRTVSSYRDIATRQGLDERDVVIPMEFIPQQAAPPPGDIAGVEVRTLKTGQQVRVRKMPDGSYEEVQ